MRYQHLVLFIFFMPALTARAATIDEVGNIHSLSRRWTVSPSYSVQYSFSNLEFYYYDKLTRLFEQDRVRSAARDMTGRVVLLCQFYHAPDERKRGEMLASLQLNLFSPYIYKVYLLQERHNATLNRWISERVAAPEGKLDFHVLPGGGGRATFGAFVDFANTRVLKESREINKTLIVAAANNDNLLVSASMLNLRALLQPEWERTLMPISRVATFEERIETYTRSKRERNNSQKCRHHGIVGAASADVFAFVPPLDYRIHGADFDVAMGTSHIEGLVFWQLLLRVPSWGLFNPCRWVNMYHNHRYRYDGTGEIIYRDISMIRPPYTELAFPARVFDPGVRYTNESINGL